MKFFIKTLGCKVNWLDSARISAALQSAGHIAAESEAEADTVLVNSCTVTAEADRKSRQTAGSALKQAKQVAVMGCGPRAAGEQGAQWQAGESLVFADEEALLQHFGVETDALFYPLHTSRTRLPVAIQAGCDNHCSFCITRIARGRHRSLPAEAIVEHVQQAVELGVKEVVLTGINLAAWGCSDSNRAGESRLPELLRRLLAETAVPRIRLSSLGPEFLHPEFFEVYADERICDHLHLSIQSGSPAILRAMQRGHGLEEIHRIVAQARAVRPDTAFTTDLIVGFPGEGEAEFEETLTMVRSIGFAALHVFPFSPREGTPAACLPGQLEKAEKKRRAAILRQLGEEQRRAFIESQLGKTHRVLVEKGGWGQTGNYIKAKMGPLAQAGEIQTVTLSSDITSTR